MLNKNQIKNIEKKQVLVFATSDLNGQPRCVWVQPSRILKDRIILSSIQMEKTLENIKQNNKCFVNVYFPEQDDLQYKIEGEATVLSGGKLFEEIKNFEESENLPANLKVNSIIVIDIKKFEESNG